MIAAIRRNFGLKLLSLTLAVLAWAYFRFATNPVIAARFDQQLSVPITTANLGPGYIATFPDRVAVVTVEPKRGDPPMKPDEIKAVLDLSGRSAGVYNVPVQLVAPSVVVKSLSPASVTLSVERVEQKTLPVAVFYGGQVSVVVSHYTLTPSSVTVSGPTSELAQVATVRIDMPTSATTATINEMIRPTAVDSSGNEIRDVQVAPNQIRVQAKFQPATH